MKRKALGKGLDALLPSKELETRASEVDIDLLYPNPNQPRMQFSKEGIDELALSIEENGIVQPIVVRKKGDHYEIIAGERRWRAAQKAGLGKVPITILDVPDEKMLELALLENIQREDLNPVEEAKAYKILIEDKGLRQEDLARRLGKGRTTITNALRLLQLHPNVLKMVEDGALTPGQARPLLSLDDPSDQKKFAQLIIKKGLSARDVEKLVSDIKTKRKRTKGKKILDPNIQAAQEKLTRRFGAKVQIQHGPKGGKIVIHYSSDDELERLFNELAK